MINGSSGALETTYVNPSPNFFRCNSDGAQWMAGLGEYVLKDKGYKMTVTQEAKELLISKGTSLEYGARPLRRAIEHYLEDPLADELLHGRFQGKDTIMVSAGPIAEGSEEKKLIFDSTAAPPPETPELVGAGEEKK